MRTVRTGPVTILLPTSRRERRRGLLGRRKIGPHEALLLERCRSVHTVGMRCAIDVVVLDGDRRILEVLTVRPGRVVLPRRRGRHVLETAAGRGAAIAQAIQAPAPGASPSTTHRSPRSRSA